VPGDAVIRGGSDTAIDAGGSGIRKTRSYAVETTAAAEVRDSH